MAYKPTRLAEEDTPVQAEVQSPPQAERRKARQRRKKRWPLILAVVLVVLLAGAAALAAAYQGLLPVNPALLPDLNAKNGTLHAENPDAPVEEGTYRFVVNKQPVMEAGKNTCNLELENVSGNHFAVRCVLTLTETGEVLWSGHRLEPGKFIKDVRLSADFRAGEYPLTLNYRFFDGAEEIGAGQDIDLTLIVK